VAARAICVLSLSVASALAFSPSTPVLRGSVSASLSAVRHRQQPPVAASRGVGRSSAALSSLKMGFLDVLKDMAMPTEIADSPDRAPEVPVADGPVTFEAGVSEIADPRHAMEDAWFVGESEFGIFDGVSGAKKSENQEGIYSFMLSAYTQRFIQNQKVKRGTVDCTSALESASVALADTLSIGASTACVSFLDTATPGYSVLRGCNVGDSGMSLFRKNAETGAYNVVWKTNSQQHFFNCPFQLGGSSPDSPDQAMRFNVPIAAGDILIMASDGLYDNVYENQLEDLVEYTKDQTSTEIAQALVGYARQQQEDPNILVPYGVEAKAAGQSWTGGKLDDTCCMVLKFA